MASWSKFLSVVLPVHCQSSAVSSSQGGWCATREVFASRVSAPKGVITTAT